MSIQLRQLALGALSLLLAPMAAHAATSYASVAAMEAETAPGTALHAHVSAYVAGSPFGGGDFDALNLASATPDGCVTFPSGATGWVWVRERPAPNQIDVTDCGAQPGVTSSTNDAAIAAAFAYANSQLSGWTKTPYPWFSTEGMTVTWAPGHYIYGGSGIVQNGGNVLTSAQPNTVSIDIVQNVYFFTDTAFVQNSYVSGLHFVGGKGAFHYTFAGPMVGGYHMFEHNVFTQYTEAAVANDAHDSPNAEFCYNQLFGTTTSIGFVWGGFVDDLLVCHNEFSLNRYHIKIGPRLSGSADIENNDFLSFAANATAADVWIVPNTSEPYGTDAGRAFILQHNRFGNENLNPAAPRILVAIEDTTQGTDRASYPPSTAWQASGAYMAGLMVVNNRFAGVAGETAPIILSYINELQQLSWRGNIFDGGPYNYLCQFGGTGWTGSYTNINWDVDLGPGIIAGGSAPFISGICNVPTGVYSDRSGFMSWAPGVQFARSSVGDDTSYVNLASIAGHGDISLIAAKESATPNALGIGATGAEVTVTTAAAPQSFAYASLAAPVAGTPAELDLDLAAGLTNSVSTVSILVINYADHRVALSVPNVPLPANWKTLRIPFVLPPDSTSGGWQLHVSAGNYTAGSATDFRLARINLYQANQAMNSNNLRIVGANAGSWNGAHVMLGPVHMWWDATNNVLRVKNGAPASATDGNLVSLTAGAQGPSGNTATVTPGSATSVFANTTFSGGTGTSAYTVGDLVKALKALGLLAP